MNLNTWRHRAAHVRPNTGVLGSPYAEQIAEIERTTAIRVEEARQVGLMAHAIVESYGGSSEGGHPMSDGLIFYECPHHIDKRRERCLLCGDLIPPAGLSPCGHGAEITKLRDALEDIANIALAAYQPGVAP